MSAPLPANESRRLKALSEYHLLDTAPEQVFDDLTLLAAQICGCPIALVTCIAEARQWFKSKIGIEGEETRQISYLLELRRVSRELAVALGNRTN